MIRLEDILKSLEDILKTSWRSLEDIFARHFEDFKRSWRYLADVSAEHVEDDFATCREDIWPKKIYSS